MATKNMKNISDLNITNSDDISNNIQSETEHNEEKNTAIKTNKKKKFEESEPIECMSITSGELGMTGIKTGIVYKWAGRGDITEVEYQDLVAAIRSGKRHITEPFFIIQNDEFLDLFPQVKEKYSSMYSINDLKDVLKLPVSQMKKIIESLPNGAKESIKHIASSMIAKGAMDSVQKIKVLDEIYGTKFMLMTELFN